MCDRANDLSVMANGTKQTEQHFLIANALKGYKLKRKDVHEKDTRYKMFLRTMSQ